MKKVQVGFIGAGNFITANHLLTARDSKIMEIRAIADLNTELLQRHSGRMKIGYTATDYKKLLSDKDIDIIIIGTKQDLHSKLIVESLNAGKWVLCEKPMSETREQTRAVLEAEKNNPGKLALGFNRRFAPSMMRLKKLMQGVKKPWFINYRLMYPNPMKHGENNFYANHERILYEGCHILDLVSWILEADPVRVYMSGDRLYNNCCILEYPNGDRVTFMCGSMGSYCHWKESIEVFSYYQTISVFDFTDMRVRGFKGEFDSIYGAYRGEHDDAIIKYGFDFCEAYKYKKLLPSKQAYLENYGMIIEEVKRPIPYQFNLDDYNDVDPDLWNFVCNKGWFESVEHFAKSYLDRTEPLNANGRAGALATEIALVLLESLEKKQPIDFKLNI